MTDRFFIRTFRIEPEFMPAFFKTTIYDWLTGLSVDCTSETQEESEAEAAKQMAVLLTQKNISPEKPGQYAPWRY